MGTHSLAASMRLLLVSISISLVPSSLSLCMIQGCNKWWNGGAKTDRKITGACAVLFDENCQVQQDFPCGGQGRGRQTLWCCLQSKPSQQLPRSKDKGWYRELGSDAWLYT